MSNEMRGGVIKRGNNWAYVVNVTDPKTGSRRQVWQGGFTTRQDAVDARSGRLLSIAAPGSYNQL